jgi:UDP-N-acetylmuramoyl-tripeptide--D-alanyl-D-alanine ligase
VAFTLGLGKREIAKATQKLKSVRGRIEINDFGKAVLIDDTYNSNPVSVKAATEVLRRVKVFPEKLLILGDMFELGKQSAEMHRSLSTEILRLKNFKVLTLGRNMKKLADALGDKAIHFSSREKLKYFLLTEKLDGKVILVKGSRGMKMEEFVDLIKQRFAE